MHGWYKECIFEKKKNITKKVAEFSKKSGIIIAKKQGGSITKRLKIFKAFNHNQKISKNLFEWTPFMKEGKWVDFNCYV